MDATATRGPVGVVGLGLMGRAMAERLLENGYTVVVWNRTREKAVPLLTRGARWSDNPWVECRRVVVSLYTTGVVREVIQAMRAELRPGRIVIDTTTGEPEDAAALGRELAAGGVTYLDAPISGSSEQTRRGESTILVGGDSAGFEACSDLWKILGNRVFAVGPCGSAAKLKLVSNLVLGLNRAALAEGLAYAEAIGVRPAAALEVLLGTMAYSRIMDTKGLKMVEGDFRVQARLSQHLKDVRLMIRGAGAAGLGLPLSDTHRRLLEEAEAAGLGELDNSAILQVIRRTPSRPRP